MSIILKFTDQVPHMCGKYPNRLAWKRSGLWIDQYFWSHLLLNDMRYCCEYMCCDANLQINFILISLIYIVTHGNFFSFQLGVLERKTLDVHGRLQWSGKRHWHGSRVLSRRNDSSHESVAGHQDSSRKCSASRSGWFGETVVDKTCVFHCQLPDPSDYIDQVTEPI